jgi:hypothetical protein
MRVIESPQDIEAEVARKLLNEDINLIKSLPVTQFCENCYCSFELTDLKDLFLIRQTFDGMYHYSMGYRVHFVCIFCSHVQRVNKLPEFTAPTNYMKVMPRSKRLGYKLKNIQWKLTHKKPTL